MLTPSTRSAINLGVPVVLTGITAFMLVKAGKQWKFVLIVCGIVFLVSWIVSQQITKVVASQGPAPVPTGGGCDTYDPKALTDSIYADLNSSWYTSRNDAPYNTLLGLSDCQVRTVYNYWNANYFGSFGNLTLPAAIAAASGADAVFANLQPAMADKISTLSLQ